MCHVRLARGSGAVDLGNDRCFCLRPKSGGKLPSLTRYSRCAAHGRVGGQLHCTLGTAREVVWQFDRFAIRTGLSGNPPAAYSDNEGSC